MGEETENEKTNGDQQQQQSGSPSNSSEGAQGSSKTQDKLKTSEKSSPSSPAWAMSLQQVLVCRELSGIDMGRLPSYKRSGVGGRRPPLGHLHGGRSPYAFGSVTTDYYDLFEHNRDRCTLYQRDLKGHTGCVNAVEFSSNGEEFFVSGGDDLHVQVWRCVDAFVAEKPRPLLTMNTTHASNIFALRFSLNSERIYSGANDCKLLVHNVATQGKLRSYEMGGACYRIATHPTNDHVIAAASENSQLHVYDLREKSQEGSLVGEKRTSSYYSVDYNDANPNLLSACGHPTGLCIYDMRQPKDCYAHAPKSLTKEAICADFSADGKFLFCIVQRDGPLFFDLELSRWVRLADPEYANLSTIKSCTFAAGNDYVLTGSDDWNIYVWKAPNFDDFGGESGVATTATKASAAAEDWGEKKVEKAYTVLRGHRSVVNHVRYSQRNGVILSCGVEKIVKCWSPIELRNSYRDPPRRERNPRLGLWRGLRFDFEDDEEDDTDDDASHHHHTADDTAGGGGSEEGGGERVDSLFEEDLDTLHQFDFYYQQAVLQRDGVGHSGQRRRLIELIMAYDPSSDDSMTDDGDNDDGDGDDHAVEDGNERPASTESGEQRDSSGSGGSHHHYRHHSDESESGETSPVGMGGSNRTGSREDHGALAASSSALRENSPHRLLRDGEITVKRRESAMMESDTSEASSSRTSTSDNSSSTSGDQANEQDDDDEEMGTTSTEHEDIDSTSSSSAIALESDDDDS